MRGGGVGGGSSGGGGGVTLDGAYDFGGAGAGRAITADAGAVTISSTAADNNSLLSLTKNPAGAQSGAGLSVTMGANATGAAITISHAGSGNGIAANDGSGAAPAYAFANEPGLGFYRGGAGTVYLTSTAGNNSTFFGIAPRSSAPTGSTALAIYAEDNGGGVPTRGLILYAIPSNASSGAFFRPSTGYTVADGNLSGGLVVGTSGGANQPLYFGSDAIVMARVNSAQGNDLTVTLSADTKLGWTSTAAGSGMFGAITLDTQLKRDAAGIAGLYAAGSTYGSMRLAGLSLGGVVSVVSGQIRVASGNGGINHLLGPTDQTLSIISGVAANGAGQSLDLLGHVATAASGNSGGYVNILAGAGDGAAAGGGATVTGGAGGATGTGGPVTITGGGAAGAAGGLVSVIGGSVSAGATDKNAGGVSISTGTSTGNGTSSIVFKVAPVGASGTLANAPITCLTLAGAASSTATATFDLRNGGLAITGQTNGAAGNTGTLGNAPTTGDPNFWLQVQINGVSRFIPAW